MIGAKVKIFVFRHVQLCFSNLAPDIVPRIFGLFSILISEIGQKFLIRIQGEIHPSSCRGPCEAKSGAMDVGESTFSLLNQISFDQGFE